MTRTDTQAAQILAHLRAGNSITPMEALDLFGCFRLGARIYDLKAEGHDIITEFETDGEKRWAKYSLARRPVMQCDHQGQGMLL